MPHYGVGRSLEGCAAAAIREFIRSLGVRPAGELEPRFVFVAGVSEGSAPR